jgi:hypothetical protein
MPTNTYTPIASVTLSATASEVVFSGLPQSFRDLIVVVDGTSTTDTGLLIQFNGDTTNANYPYVWMLGNGSTTSSGTATIPTFGDIRTYSNSNIIQIMDYSATDKQKTVLNRGNFAGSTNPFVIAFAGRWANTAAINSIRLAPNGFNFNSGSTLTIYGVIA